MKTETGIDTMADIGAAVDTRRAIIEHSFRLFVERGFTDVSVNDILNRAGTTKGGFYHYFKSKDELIEAVFQEFVCAYFDNALINLPTSCIRETMEALCGVLIGYEDYIRETCRDMEMDFAQLHYVVADGVKKFRFMYRYRCSLYRRIKQLLCDTLHAGIRQGIIRREVEPQVLAVKLLTLYEGAILIHVLDKEYELKRESKKSFEEIWASISA